jgi:hypothetical protein
LDLFANEFRIAPEFGVDLPLLWPRFAVWLLSDPEWGMMNFARSVRSKNAIGNVAALYTLAIEGRKIGIARWRGAAMGAAHSAAPAASCAVSACTVYIHTCEYPGGGDAAESDARIACAYAVQAYSIGSHFDESAYGDYKRTKMRKAQANKLLELKK